jgi:hypothetical protein
VAALTRTPEPERSPRSAFVAEVADAVVERLGRQPADGQPAGGLSEPAQPGPKAAASGFDPGPRQPPPARPLTGAKVLARALLRARDEGRVTVDPEAGVGWRPVDVG